LVSRCWTCDPNKHPSKSKCKDCGVLGHFTKNSPKCSKNAPDGVAGAAKRASEDDSFPGPDGPQKLAKYSDELAQTDLRRSLKGGKAFSVTNSKDTEVFVLDSGCTQSILMNKELLTNFRPYEAKFMTADAGQLNIIGKGDLFINTELTLKDVLLCPQIALNLLSVSQMCAQGLTVQTNKTSMLVLRNRTVILSALHNDGLYQFRIRQPMKELALSVGSNRTQLFHRRMGHLNYKQLRLLQHLSHGVVLDKDPSDLCEACILAKSHKQPFPPSSSLAKTIGEITHCDICHIGTPDIYGNLMFMCLVDDASRHCTLYLLKHKDEGEDCLKTYDRKIWVKTGHHCKIFRSDGGGEFFSNSFAEYCDTHGITQESSTPYTPQQNGRAERINRTILESTSALLTDSGLPFQYWGLAAECAVYLKNRSPHSALYRSTPYQEWHQRLPDLTNVRVFGSVCYVFTPTEIRKKLGPGNKLQPKSRKMLFVGYSDKHKAWKTIDPTNHDIVYSPNVVFGNETTQGNTSLTNKTLTELAGPLNSNPPADAGEEPQEGEDLDNSLEDSPKQFANMPEGNPHTLPESSNSHQPEGIHHATQENELPESGQRVPVHLPDHTIAPPTDKNYELNQTYKSSSFGKWKIVDSNSKPLKWDPNNLPVAGTKRNRNQNGFSFASWMHTFDVSDAFINVPLNVESSAFTAQQNHSEPHYQTAINGPDKALWNAAIQKEYDSLKEKEVFSSPCKLPKGFKTLDTKMVLKIKEPESLNSTRRYKARLCARGFRQEEGVDYDFTFAPVATYHALRLFLSIMASLNYEIHTIDVITAFLHSPLKEEIYIRIPDGFPNAGQLKTEGLVIRLLKCLYGLKQSNMEWNAELNIFLTSLGFVACNTEACVYLHPQRKQYLLIYVDDIIIATESTLEMTLLKKTIHEKYPISDKGPISKFLNMNVTRDRRLREIYIIQSSKIENILNDSRLSNEDLKIVRTPSKLPACPNTRLKTNCLSRIDKPYRGILGQALHIAITCRPDIMTAVSLCGRYSENPSTEHWSALLRILSYLNGTKGSVLKLGGNHHKMVLFAYSDSDWAGDLDERKSRSGYLILLNSSSIIWSSKLQVSVALSSTEAEYVALSLASRDVIWLRNLLSEMGFSQESSTKVYEDNQSCIKIAISTKQLPGTKHIDIRHHFIRQRIESREIELVGINTRDMVADVFTKSLPNELFKKHIMAIGIATKGKC
jgi:transposase InsO family protein